MTVLASTLAVTCLMAMVVYNAEVPSALLQTSQLVSPLSLTRPHPQYRTSYQPPRTPPPTRFSRTL